MEDLDAATELALLSGGGDLLASDQDSHLDLNESELLGDVNPSPSAPTNGDSTNGAVAAPVSIVKSEDVDLYDDAIAPSGQSLDSSKRESVSSASGNVMNMSSSAMSTSSSHAASSDRKYCCYIGNMTWWTTDADLQLHFNTLGINDVIEMKFFENRLNGQSKGYALCMFGSDHAVRTVTEKLPQRTIHGASVCVLPYTKQSLARLEEAVAKTQTRADPKVPKKEDNCLNMGTIRIGATGPPTAISGPGPAPLMGQMMMRPGGMGGGGGGGPMQMHGGQMQMNRGAAPLSLMINGQPMQQQPPPMMRPMGGVMGAPGGMPAVQLTLNLPPGAPRPLMGGQHQQGPPGTTPMMGAPQPLMQPMQVAQQPQQQMRPPGMMYGQPGPQPLMQQQLRPPGHQHQMGGPPPSMGGPPAQHMPPPGTHLNPQIFPGMQQPIGGISEAEFEETMNRNRTVSSSAISRAVADAAAGETKAAIETLLTAISLIKQSRVAQDDRCRLLIGSLQDTLNGIESKAHQGGGRSKHRDRDRSRSRSRDRDRKRRRRSRSMSRSRSRSPRHSRSSRHY